MSEGTMQRRAQREQRDDLGAPGAPAGRQGGERSPGRLIRVAAGAAAVPAMLLAAGCSSGGADADPKPSDSASASASPSPTVQAAAYRTLPKACAVLTPKTLGELVPEGAKKGKEGSSDDISTRASCSWSSLDNNGVKGSQFRWLNISMLRFDSDAVRGEGEKLAHDYYAKQVRDAKAAQGAKNTREETAAGTGDEATAVRYDLKKKEGAFRQQTIVARVENVVVTLDYNGAGLAGDKTPNADDLAKVAAKAAREAVAAVSTANSGGPAAPSASRSGTASPAKGSSAAPSARATASATASGSAGKS
ncbi:DUF3558 family protein [Streptomyces sp. MS06]|uniref:DUF3558 family protein n=1 Tax=Streptomyces sp. MS06 TaxID=3385974 RepID=UPI0039A2002C